MQMHALALQQQPVGLAKNFFRCFQRQIRAVFGIRLLHIQRHSLNSPSWIKFLHLPGEWQ